MLSNATIRDFLRFLDPFLGVVPAGVRMVVAVVANLPPTDSYKKSKKYLELKFSSLNGFYDLLSLKKSIKNNLGGPQRLLNFGKEL